MLFCMERSCDVLCYCHVYFLNEEILIFLLYFLIPLCNVANFFHTYLLIVKLNNCLELIKLLQGHKYSVRNNVRIHLFVATKLITLLALTKKNN